MLLATDVVWYVCVSVGNKPAVGGIIELIIMFVLYFESNQGKNG